MKKFSSAWKLMKLAGGGVGCQFWVGENDSEHKNAFLKVKPVFLGKISKLDDLFLFVRGASL